VTEKRRLLILNAGDLQGLTTKGDYLVQY
jgi:hypothetical protein